MNRERILYEDRDIIVCHKAAGIATQTARIGQADMVSEITNYLVRGGNAMGVHKADSLSGQRRKDSTEPPYVGVVHRLDQPVEGVLVFARNRQAAAELGRQFSEDGMEKYYYAVVCGQAPGRSGRLTDYLLKDGRTNTSRIVPKEVKGAKKAVLEYEILVEEAIFEQSGSGETPRTALARIRLYTGRHHQIRVQMSHAGMSLMGDYKYADAGAIELSEQLHVREIALCAYSLAFTHPRTGKRMQFRVRPEGRYFRREAFLPCYNSEDAHCCGV